MRNFQDTFETRKRSFICAVSICMTVPLRWVSKYKQIKYCQNKKIESTSGKSKAYLGPCQISLMSLFSDNS